MANRHSVTDGGDLKKYHAAIPNIVFKLGLNPYELALYAHFKQAAGDDGGVCWKSRATIARESGMSSGMVTKARQALETKRSELGDRALITVREEPSKGGGLPTCAIRITDIWPLNMTRFSTSPYDVATSPHDVVALTPSPHDVATSPGDPCNVTTRPQRRTLEEVIPLIPLPFRGQNFLDALAEFEAHRVEMKKPLRPVGRKRLYRDLAEWGESDAVEGLRQAVRGGYQGVFRPKGNGGPSHPNAYVKGKMIV